ncbi:hypothetical protein GCM10007940_12460 [Portibacter lacus]|uniref:DUF58 domain-containing protein n=2 Tax=Portibacter lacus TaxID=1099794 RepID=A0AA37WCM0_9BACT|nr:hypothetical protein GCM10007940_12460 [Portibacter lacus]
MSDRFSNGDDNVINIKLQNYYNQKVHLTIIDEIPFQFQRRDVSWKASMDPEESSELSYHLKPVKRGVYHFGCLNVFASFFLRLVERRFQFGEGKEVAVYPSYLQMRKYEIAAISKNLSAYGIKKVRRIGTSMEFEQIKDYVRGDDPRSINWKATARANALMINQFQEEKSQQVYSLIDKGRLMKMPFEGMSLLDYAINACLVISNIAIKKGDKAGLISFSKKLSTVVSANKRPGHMRKILEGLYRQKTRYEEANFELLAAFVRKKITERSLLLLFTNFESQTSMNRQMPYLKMLAKKHVLVVIFFRNTGIKEVLKTRPKDVEGIYHQTIAEHLDHEKNLMIKELKRHGIYGIVTEPRNLTVDTINKYLALKAKSF